MLNVNPHLRSKRPWIWIGISLILIGLISSLDVYTGNEMAVEILYLIPIFISTWWCGRKLGLWIVTASLVSWLASSYPALQNYSHPGYFYSETLSHAILWVFFVVLLAKLKDALINADEQFISILRQAESAIYVEDMNSGALLYYNKQCHDMFGVDIQLANARQIDEQLVPSPLEMVHRVDPSGDGANRPTTVECRNPKTNRWYLVYVRQIKWISGQMVRLHTMIDITPHKQAKELIQQQREKLDFGARLMTLGGIASALAHEISQPLAAIVNYNRGGMQRLRTGNIDATALLDAMGKSAEQAERAGKIIQRARTIALRREPEMESLDINEVIINLRDMIELNTQRHNVRLALALAPSLPAVRADRVMLEQLILNLSRNAIQAMQNTPSAQRTLEILTKYDSSIETVESQVIDNGCGIPDDFEKNLFQPFFTTKTEGLGLGLSLCRSIIELHKGRLWATRNPSGGSIFHFAIRTENP